MASFTPPPSANSSTELNMDGIASLLAVARQRIIEGNPSLALQAVVIALRAAGGETAVLQALGRAREMHHTRQETRGAVDELSAMFAECALATHLANDNTANRIEILDSATHAQQRGVQEMDMTDQQVPTAPMSEPILAESGRLQVVMDASADGSSFVCLQCGGVVSNQRRDEHVAFWCSRPIQ